MPGIEIDRKENGVREIGPKRFDNEQRTIRIGPHNPDRSGALSLVMNTGHKRPDIVDLAGSFRTLPRGLFGLVADPRIPCPCCSLPVIPRDLPIEPAEIAVAKDVQRERFIISRTPDLQINGLRDRPALFFDCYRHQNGIQVAF